GIVIDLSKYINTVRVDHENKLGFVGGGASWKDVDEEAITYGLASVGGTVNHTGVGGLTLGGSYGWLTGEHGMVIDNLVQLDLVWAIRGGGTNFGCVTEFVYRLHPQRATVYAGPLIFPPSMIETVTATLDEWYRDASEKEAILLVTTSRRPTGDPAIVVCVFFNGDEEGVKQGLR
ncbi:2121_t:CDS:2, partial [Acaulospora colombiana]